MEGKEGRSGRIASEYATVGRRLSEKDTVEVCAVDSRWRRMNNPVLRMLTSRAFFNEFGLMFPMTTTEVIHYHPTDR